MWTILCSCLARQQFWVNLVILSPPRGSGAPRQEHALGACAADIRSSRVQYLATMHLRGWHVLLVLILEKEENQGSDT